MMGKLPYTAPRDAVFTHPTVGEGLPAHLVFTDGAQDPDAVVAGITLIEEIRSDFSGFL